MRLTPGQDQYSESVEAEAELGWIGVQMRSNEVEAVAGDSPFKCLAEEE